MYCIHINVSRKEKQITPWKKIVRKNLQDAWMPLWAQLVACLDCLCLFIFNFIKIFFHFRLSWCRFLISHKMVIFSFLLKTKQLMKLKDYTLIPQEKRGQGSLLPATFQLNFGVRCFMRSVHTVVRGNCRWWRSDSEKLRDLFVFSQGWTPLRQRAKPTELAFILLLLLLTLHHKVQMDTAKDGNAKSLNSLSSEEMLTVRRWKN